MSQNFINNRKFNRENKLDLKSFLILTGHSKRQVIHQQTLEVHLERGTGHLRETEVIYSTPVQIF